MEMGSTDYHGLLGVSTIDQQDAFEKWLNNKEKADYPDPPELPFNDTMTFKEFDSSLAFPWWSSRPFGRPKTGNGYDSILPRSESILVNPNEKKWKLCQLLDL